MAAEISATTIFCDDIRQEVNNKASLIGCYGSRMLLENIPAVLPRLCAAAYIKIRPGVAVGSIAVRALLGAETIASFALPDAVQSIETLRASGQGSDDGCVTLSAFMVLSPFMLSEPSTLRIMIDVDGAQITAGMLGIKKPDSPIL